MDARPPYRSSMTARSAALLTSEATVDVSVLAFSVENDLEAVPVVSILRVV